MRAVGAAQADDPLVHPARRQADHPRGGADQSAAAEAQDAAARVRREVRDRQAEEAEGAAARGPGAGEGFWQVEGLLGAFEDVAGLEALSGEAGAEHRAGAGGSPDFGDAAVPTVAEQGGADDRMGDAAAAADQVAALAAELHGARGGVCTARWAEQGGLAVPVAEQLGAADHGGAEGGVIGDTPAGELLGERLAVLREGCDALRRAQRAGLGAGGLPGLGDPALDGDVLQLHAELWAELRAARRTRGGADVRLQHERGALDEQHVAAGQLPDAESRVTLVEGPERGGPHRAAPEQAAVVVIDGHVAGVGVLGVAEVLALRVDSPERGAAVEVTPEQVTIVVEDRAPAAVGAVLDAAGPLSVGADLP